jgi:D-glycerate 3-kinase
MPEIIDDKSEHCVPFIIDRIKVHRESFESKGEKPTPFFVGLNGVQGAGKTTLVCINHEVPSQYHHISLRTRRTSSTPHR